MRLLDTRTGAFRWINNPEEVRYAILSHAWAVDGEQTYQDLLQIQADVRGECASGADLPLNEVLLRASPKIRDACAYALAEGFNDLWIDSCCIDKTSSAELSEAINSMYHWYSQSIICYAFLDDVTSREDPSEPGSWFRSSRWFTRGWTLQELIAPRIVVFVSAEWDMLGSKDGLSAIVEDVTGIDQEILVHLRPLNSVSVARRMSWAAKRFTTRKEDEAYSLMGIFGVNMPTIYGEGRLAFIRLQEEILKLVPDQSIFAWQRTRPSWDPDYLEAGAERALFAMSPADFELSSSVEATTVEEAGNALGIVIGSPPTYTITPYGLRTVLPLVTLSPTICVVYLACKAYGSIIGVVLQKLEGAHAWSVGASLKDLKGRLTSTAFPESPRSSQRLVLAPSSADAPLPNISVEELCIVHRPTLTLSPRLRGPAFPRVSPVQLYGDYYTVKLPKWCQSRLAAQGYTVSLSSTSAAQSTSLYPSPSSYTMRVRGDRDLSLDVTLGPCSCRSGVLAGTWWLAARVASSTHDVRSVPRPPSQRQLLIRSTTACKEPGAHVESWEPVEGDGWGRRLGLVLRAGPPLVAVAVELVLTCDYQGDGHYPALFSLWVDVQSVDPQSVSPVEDEPEGSTSGGESTGQSTAGTQGSSTNDQKLGWGTFRKWFARNRE